MALWQWDVWIVPKKKVAELFDVPKSMDLELFESTDWWTSVSKQELETFFDKSLRRYDTPWATDTKSWGSDDGDRIELMAEDATVRDVVIRIDLRDLNLELLSSLVLFARSKDFLFYSLETGKFIEPSLSDLIDEIGQSRKMKFVQDPKAFFEDETYLARIHEENLRRIEEDR